MKNKLSVANVVAMNQLNFKDGKSLPDEELEKVAQIDNQIPAEFDSNWSLVASSINERLEYYKKLADSDFFKVVYDVDEIIAFHIVRDGKSGIAIVSTIWVHPKFRQQGIGKMMKELGVSWAKDRGFKFIQTSVHCANERMLEINRDNGFEPFSVSMRLKL